MFEIKEKMLSTPGRQTRPSSAHFFPKRRGILSNSKKSSLILSNIVNQNSSIEVLAPKIMNTTPNFRAKNTKKENKKNNTLGNNVERETLFEISNDKNEKRFIRY